MNRMEQSPQGYRYSSDGRFLGNLGSKDKPKTKAVEAKTTNCFSSMEPRLNHLVALVGTPVMACTVAKTMVQSLLRVVTFQDFWQKHPLELPYSLKERSIDFLTHVGNIFLTPLVLLATVIINIAGIICGNKPIVGTANFADLHGIAEVVAIVGVATCARSVCALYKNRDLRNAGPRGLNDPDTIRAIRLTLAGAANIRDLFISTSLLNALMIKILKNTLFTPEQFQQMKTDVQKMLEAEAQPKPA